MTPSGREASGADLSRRDLSSGGGSTAGGLPDPSAIQGLTRAEAAARLHAGGYNELPSERRRGLGASALAVVREPMTLLLLGCGGIYVAVGDLGEALLLIGFVAFIVAITIYQETKTGRALEALRDLTSPRALVVRDGVQQRIAGREVVRGDKLVLAEGDRVPADAKILICGHFTVDESLLTGEAVPVRKVPWNETATLTRPGGDDLPFVFAGTLVVQGQALAEVGATGVRSEMGHIGTALKGIVPEETRLQRETKRLVGRLGAIGGVLSVAVFVLHGLRQGSWLAGLLAGLTLAMAILPNELPVVVTLFLALGARRLSLQRVLTRRVPAVETLGAVTVLCVDKTGTLTQNRMTVSRLTAGDVTCEVPIPGGGALPEAVHPIVEYSILASRRDPFDPMEQAFKRLGEHDLAGTEHLHAGWTLVREYPLMPGLLAVTQVWQPPGKNPCVVAVKGAPEAVGILCALDHTEMADLVARSDAMARDGLRVLAVASGTIPADALPDRPGGFVLRLVGLVALTDPVRPAVPAAVGGVSRGGHPRRHDHRRPSHDRTERGASGGPGSPRRGAHRPGHRST